MLIHKSPIRRFSSRRQRLDRSFLMTQLQGALADGHIVECTAPSTFLAGTVWNDHV